MTLTWVSCEMEKNLQTQDGLRDTYEAFAIALHSRIKVLPRNYGLRSSKISSSVSKLETVSSCLSGILSRDFLMFAISFQYILPTDYSLRLITWVLRENVHFSSYTRQLRTVTNWEPKKNTWAETYLQQVSRRLAIKQHKINLDPWWSYYAISWIQPFSIVHFWFFSANSFFRIKWICSVKRMRILTAVNNIFEKPQHLCLLPLKTFVSLRLENMKLKPFNKCKRGFKEN